MALQLSIYPQYNTTGQFSYVSTPVAPNLVNDPNFFLTALFSGSSFGTSYPISGNQPSFSAVSQYLPNGLWQAFHTNGVGNTATTKPTFQNIGNLNVALVLQGVGGSSTGVYQMIDGLTVGHDYTVSVKLHNTGTGYFYIGNIYNFGTFNSGGTNYWHIPENAVAAWTSVDITGLLTYTFTAQNTEEYLLLDYHAADTQDLKITEVSVRESEETAPELLSRVHDGQVLVDLMDANSVPVTLSIDNFKNVGEKPQSYSKAFNLPSTKNNNIIFSTLFDVTRSVKEDGFAFNPYKMTKAILKEDSLTIFDGYLKLIAVKEKDGIVSYNVNLFSDVVSLKKILSKKTLNDFDGGQFGGGHGLSELEHPYNKNSIKDSWDGSLEITPPTSGYTGSLTYTVFPTETTTNVLKYPFCRWSPDIYQSDGSSGPLLAPVISELPDAFRPWIQIKYLWDRIFSEAGFSYQSDFINTAQFKRLFMDFNWGKETKPLRAEDNVDAYYWYDASAVNTIGSSYTNLKMNSTSVSGANVPQALTDLGWSTVHSKFTCTTTTTTYVINGDFLIGNTSGSNATITCRIVHKDSTGAIVNQYTQTLTAQNNLYAAFNVGVVWNLDANDTIEIQAKTTSSNVYQGYLTYGTTFPGATVIVAVQTTPNITSSILLSKRGKIKQWDLIKDIMTMFNLVTLQDPKNANNLIIEPYEDVFITGSSSYIDIAEHDWTGKVDVGQMQIKPLKLKETVTFDYKKPKDYANKVYTSSTGLTLGSFKIEAGDFAMATGTQKIQLKVFSPTMMVPVLDDFNQVLTVPHICNGSLEEGVTDSIDNNPRILYDATFSSDPTGAGGRISVAPDTYRIPGANGLFGEDQSTFGLFSTLQGHPAAVTDLDLNFGTHQMIGHCIAPPSLGVPTHNLFNTYWSPYYDEVYHPDTRIVTVHVNLTSRELNTFNFNDKITIKNRLYRANKIDYKPGKLSKVELILLP
tara:strand:+ start:19621 stop:22530 length:2910 start_codon:yes stop_codon:yes gene_type:complete